ncbi:transporter substrate-binding domain-containing protein [Rhizobium sp. KVB221]|uniref:Transporter substrate-binding domain-containing protein n=1 Tax=Rhizobium setariae TaxID=2801340 RepID=A0A936YLE5_9HYPH|nr:transporter substrate-binding domain-containing protein [Rhizobium setariae]MBL0372478.1 transporter substrate-binding domain-containing protein [Rhizobium setariae]
MRAFFLTFVVSASCGPLAAQERSSLSMPLMFDQRERIPAPDLATVPRIRFLTSVDFPPFNFLDQSGKLSGFHVDLAREICTELKVVERCQIEAMPFKELQGALDKGDGEVVLAGMRITPELRETHGFSRVFMQLPARFVIARSSAGQLTTPEKLAPGKTGVLEGTAHAAMLTTFFPLIQPKPYSSRQAMLEALKKGEIQAAFSDGLQLSFWLESADSADCCTYLGGPYYSAVFLGEGIAMMTRKDMPQITRAIDSALLALSRSGRLSEIYLRYFPNGL